MAPKESITSDGIARPEKWKWNSGKYSSNIPLAPQANQPDSGVKDLKYEQTYCDELSSASLQVS